MYVCNVREPLKLVCHLSDLCNNIKHYKAITRSGRVILKRYLGTAQYEKAFKGPRRKVSPELDSWLNSDQF